MKNRRLFLQQHTDISQISSKGLRPADGHTASPSHPHPEEDRPCRQRPARPHTDGAPPAGPAPHGATHPRMVNFTTARREPAALSSGWNSVSLAISFTPTILAGRGEAEGATAAAPASICSVTAGRRGRRAPRGESRSTHARSATPLPAALPAAQRSASQFESRREARTAILKNGTPEARRPSL